MSTYLVWSGGNNTLGTEAGGWANAATSVSALMTLITSILGGDIIKVHKTHSYVPGATNTWTLPETGAGVVTVVCVDKDNSDAPSTGAVEGTTGAFAINVNGSPSANSGIYIQGMTFRSGIGSASGSGDIICSSASQFVTFADCKFEVDSNASTADISMGSTAGSLSGLFRFERCSFKFANVGSGITFQTGIFEFVNCYIDQTGSNPTVVLKGATQSRGTIRCYGCDWRACTNVLSNTATGIKEVYMHNCVMETPALAGTTPAAPNARLEVHACGPAAASADILQYYFEDSAGTVEDDQGVYLSSGGAIGVQSTGAETPYSLRMSPSTYCAKVQPLYTPWFYKFVDSTGSKVVTMKIAHLESVPLKTSEVFMEIEYMGEPALAGTQRVAGSAQGTLEYDDDCPLVSGTICRDVLAAGSNRTDTSESWTGVTPTETNTLTASITVDVIGYVRCRVGLALDLPSASSAGVLYVDPKVNVASA